MWYSRANIYHIFIDRFAGMSRNIDSVPEFMGGNIKGITDKIDYFSELGVDCIWLSPFQATTAYHGYHIVDYNSVDPRFGSLNDLKELIETLHAKNIRIIMDFVPNHCSDKHPYFQDAIGSKDSIYKNWFHFKKWPEDYTCFLSYRELPKFNLANPDTSEYIISNAKMWLSMGIDGLRIDHAIGPSSLFWENFSREIRSLFPEAFIFGEAWTEGLKRKLFNTTDIPDKSAYGLFSISQFKTQNAYSTYFNGILDFELKNIITNHFKKNKQNLQKLRTTVLKHLSLYSENYLPVCFLDNHDMNRFSFEVDNNPDKIKEAFRFLFSLPIPVVIYYGTESGLRQPESVHSSKPYSDLNARSIMNWDSIDREYFVFFRELLIKRKNALL